LKAPSSSCCWINYGGSTQIIISPEEHFPEMQLSLVASSYGAQETSLGSLGIIGPMRMDYARLVPIVRYTASLVTNLLNQRH
jgi:heat-inducible transcriptional repressor